MGNLQTPFPLQDEPSSVRRKANKVRLQSDRKKSITPGIPRVLTPPEHFIPNQVHLQRGGAVAGLYLQEPASCMGECFMKCLGPFRAPTRDFHLLRCTTSSFFPRESAPGLELPAPFSTFPHLRIPSSFPRIIFPHASIPIFDSTETGAFAVSFSQTDHIHVHP